MHARFTTSRRSMNGTGRSRILTLATVLTTLAVVLTTYAGCSKVAVSGRNQLILIPDGELLSMSTTQYQQFLQENKVSHDQKSIAMVQKVGKDIQGAVERYFQQQGKSEALKGYAWEFNVVESKEVNAWCMPGGKVVFYTGIIPVCKDETGIAVVMGHEVAHAVAKHGAERMSQEMLAQLGGTALSVALANKPAETQSIWMTAFGVGAQYGALLPFSRAQESEADYLGLVFMAMAGYDPNAAVGFWQRMAEASSGQAPPEILSTHPSDESRIRKIQEHLPEAMQYYTKR